MKKQINYRNVDERKDTLRIRFLLFFLTISSSPRMLLEVFIRKSFGERYFNLSSALWTFASFFMIPVSLYLIAGPFNPFQTYGVVREMAWGPMFARWWLYFIYLGAFLIMCYFRYQEIKREPSIFDLGKFSRSHGTIHPFFRKLRYKGKLFTTRQIETIYEPLFCFACGLVLYFINTPAGILVMICAIIYRFSYRAMYLYGDYQIMDYLDDIILLERFQSLNLPDGSPGSNGNLAEEPGHVSDGDSPNSKGFNPRWQTPQDANLRRRVYSQIINEDIPDVR